MGILDRVSVDPGRLADRRVVADPWFAELPAIQHLIGHGIDLSPGVTVIVGENGSGKSTFVEGLAQRWGDSLTAAVAHWRPPRHHEDADLHRALVLAGEHPRPQGGCFLRAEAMHGLFADIDAGPQLNAFDGRLNQRSHGESFLEFLESRLSERGLFVLDEPEAALSFTSCLRLLAILDAATATGSQVVLATHSPVLAAFPDATILEFGDHGIRDVAWEDLELIAHWRGFLDNPASYLRHLFTD
jgi:predicted ATPase